MTKLFYDSGIAKGATRCSTCALIAIVVTATVATNVGNRRGASSGAVPTDVTNRAPLAGSIIAIVSMHTGVVAGSSRPA
jgi:hypothetical protein